MVTFTFYLLLGLRNLVEDKEIPLNYVDSSLIKAVRPIESTQIDGLSVKKQAMKK